MVVVISGETVGMNDTLDILNIINTLDTLDTLDISTVSRGSRSNSINSINPSPSCQGSLNALETGQDNR